METYSILREIADSWVLLVMFIFFVAVGVWAFLPSQKAAREDARNIPFRNDVPVISCPKACENCTCGQMAKNLEVQTHV